ncbi:MAG: hypothetical protein OEU98_09070, partial [Actinomycetota bacterium]|nr:hypothetical protein [Actinomycetota bacterium]
MTVTLAGDPTATANPLVSIVVVNFRHVIPWPRSEFWATDRAPAWALRASREIDAARAADAAACSTALPAAETRPAT